MFPSPAIGTDQKNIIPSYNQTTNQPSKYSPTDFLGTFSTLTSSDEQWYTNSLSHQNSQLRSFRMYDIPEFISLPQQLVFRPYVSHRTAFHCSSSNNILLPLASRKPRIVKPRPRTYQKNTILQFLKPSKKLRVLHTHSP